MHADFPIGTNNSNSYYAKQNDHVLINGIEIINITYLTVTEYTSFIDSKTCIKFVLQTRELKSFRIYKEKHIFYSVSSPWYINLFLWCGQGQKIVTNNFENCWVTVLAVGAYVVQLCSLGLYFSLGQRPLPRSHDTISLIILEYHIIILHIQWK